MRLCLWFVGFLSQLAGGHLSAQPVKTIRADADLVLVNAVVADRKGTPVTALEAGQFTVFEDHVQQAIVSFSREEAPCSVGVIVDLSGSMRRNLPAATAAIREFLTAFNPQDEAFLMAVSSQPESLFDFTSDTGTLQNHLNMAEAEGNTALIDTILLALHRIRTAHNARRALFVVSDGMDNHSRFSKAELFRAIQEQEVPVYTVGIAIRSPGKRAMELAEESVDWRL